LPLPPIINPTEHKRKEHQLKLTQTTQHLRNIAFHGACNHSAHNLMSYITDMLLLPFNLSYCNILINFKQGHNFHKGLFKLPDSFRRCVTTL